MHILNVILADSGIFRILTYLGTQCFMHMQAYSAPSNMSLSNILYKTKHF